MLHCFNCVVVRSIFTNRSAFPVVRKDVLSTHPLILVICQYKCQSEAAYVAVIVRIAQYVSGPILKHAPTTSGGSQTHESTISDQLFNCDKCSTNYSEEFFPVLPRARTKHHLNVLGVVINSQRRLCVDIENFDTVYECKDIMIADFLISILLNMNERMY